MQMYIQNEYFALSSHAATSAYLITTVLSPNLFTDAREIEENFFFFALPPGL